MGATADGRQDRWVARLALGALVLALALSSCSGGGDTLSTRGSSEPGRPAADSPPEVDEAEQLFDEISRGLLPTSSQADSVRYLEHVGFQTLISDCMSGLGFTYVTPPAFTVPRPVARRGEGTLDPVEPAAIRADELGLNAVLDGIVENAKAGEAFVLDAGSPDGPRIPDHEVPGWDEALESCMPADEEVNAWVGRPSYDLGDPFKALFNAALLHEDVSAAASTYPTCIGDAGWKVDDRHNLVLAVLGEFENAMLDAEPSFSSDSTKRAEQVDEVVGSAAWEKAAENRSRAAQADADCRRAAHDLAFTLLLEPLKAFKAENEQLIERTRSEWQALEERADQTEDPGRTG